MEKSTNETHRRWLDHLRFRWHESILRDTAVRRHPCAMALAGHIMHRFSAVRGYAQFSSTSAAKALNMPERSVKRSAKFLRHQGWITPFDEKGKIKGNWGANAYILIGGPNGLSFNEEGGRDDDDTVGAVT